MRMRLLTLMAMFALAGCASTGGGKLAVCDGKHLRPANAYGTVLAPAAEGGAAAPSAGAGEAKPKVLSLLAAPATFGSCRA